MNEGKRPGGLTALAVINFVFCGGQLLGILGWIVIFALSTMKIENMNEQQRTQWEAMQNMSRPLLIGLIVMSAILGILLLLSGIGYLKQKKLLGRTLGNAYAILAIAVGIVSAVLMQPGVGGGFHIGTIIGLIYPVLTLILLNTIFKEDFGN